MAEPGQIPPRCPRCGYDQSGVTAAWARQCPLSGVCSECGLELDWADVFKPDRRIVKGFFEHATGPWQYLSWSWRTLWLAPRPWSFWRRITLTVEPVPARTLAWPLVMALQTYLLGTAARFAAVVVRAQIWPRTRAGVNWWAALADACVEPLAVIPWGLGASIRILRWDLRYARYGGMLILLSITWPLLMLALARTLRLARVRWAHVARAVSYSLVWIPCLMLVRATDGLWQVWVGLAGGISPRLPIRIAPSEFLGQWAGWLLLAGFVWTAAWWWFALSHGFRLRQAPLVWGLFVIASALAAANAAVLIFIIRGAPW